MNDDNFIEPDAPVDLTTCDREPIHAPGRIQYFACLLAVTSDWIVTHASENAVEMLGLPQQDLVGETLTAVFTPDLLHRIRTELQLVRNGNATARIFGLEIGANRFNASVHVIARGFILEFERSEDSENRDDLRMVQNLIARLAGATDRDQLLNHAARGLKALSGFDRVMVYRFAGDDSGAVVAEAKEAAQEAFLGLRYPASDIPAQARALYLRQPLRLIADTRSPTVAVNPLRSPEGHVLDMSLAVSRAVSPIHIEYLDNMGVRASMSVSILRNGRLWGLFACHHDAPRRVDFKLRTAIELYGQLATYEIARLESDLEQQATRRAREVHDRLMTGVVARGDVMDAADEIMEEIGAVISHDGAAIFVDGEYRSRGEAPSREEFEALARLLNRTSASTVFARENAAELGETADDLARRLPGILAIPISRRPRDYLVLFRRPMVQTVNWAGDPSKPVTVGRHGDRLTPRKSFALWQETVTDRAAAWTEAERQAAEALRITLLEVVLKLSDEVMAERGKYQKKQELLIAELNHRVKNILSLIQSLVQQTSSTTRDLGAFTALLGQRVQSLARAHDQLTRTNWQAASIMALIEVEFAAYSDRWKDRLEISGEDVALDPPAFTTVALVIHELATNSMKYGALADSSGRVEIDLSRDDAGALVIHWRERGGPPVAAPSRRGFGSTIIERSIPFDLGGAAEIRYDPTGVVARFAIPARHIGPPPKDGTRRRDREPPQPPPTGETPLRGTVLLVEDNIIIAMDAADQMRLAGVERVVMSSNVADALNRIGDGPLDAAILDVNLGRETSLSIARRLEEEGVPFVLATGFGGENAVVDAFSDRAVLRKPYTGQQLVAALGMLLRD